MHSVTALLLFSVGFALGLVLAAVLSSRRVGKLEKALFLLSPPLSFFGWPNE